MLSYILAPIATLATLIALNSAGCFIRSAEIALSLV